MQTIDIFHFGILLKDKPLCVCVCVSIPHILLKDKPVCMCVCVYLYHIHIKMYLEDQKGND